MRSRIDWATEYARIREKLSEEQRTIIEMLAKGATQGQIANLLHVHRAVVWRKVKDMKKLL